MRPHRILILTPWPIGVPRNGGQIRAAAVAQAYRDAGHFVRTAGIYDPERVLPGEVSPADVPLSPGVIQVMQTLPATEARSEMAFWFAVARASDCFSAFAAVVKDMKPDVLQFEEPALWPLVRRLRAENLIDNVALVHSSYNFETRAWQHRSIPSAPVTHETLRDIATLEREIAESCDLIIAVSEGDAAEFRALGAERVCIAANGVRALPHATPTLARAYLCAGAPYALFVSSAHPPNARGLVDMAAASRGHPLRHGELLICGRVAPLMRGLANFSSAARVLERARFLGWVGDSILASLYAACQVVVLPKTLRGGSNLKTAEALASGCPIVATSLAFDGFETYRGLPSVTIEDEPTMFWQAVDNYLSGNLPATHREPETTKTLLWSECLRPMVRVTESIDSRFARRIATSKNVVGY